MKIGKNCVIFVQLMVCTLTAFSQNVQERPAVLVAKEGYVSSQDEARLLNAEEKKRLAMIRGIFVVKRATLFVVNISAFDHRVIRMNFPDHSFKDFRLSGEVVETNSVPNFLSNGSVEMTGEMSHWFGESDGDTASLARGTKDFIGGFRMRSAVYEIRNFSDRYKALLEIDRSRFPSDEKLPR
jgi:hypothetical protein